MFSFSSVAHVLGWWRSWESVDQGNIPNLKVIALVSFFY